MTMDALLCRDHLQRLLSDEVQALQELEVVLDKEHALIVADDIEALDSQGAHREACIGTLLRIDAERISLCRSSGRAGDKSGLLSLIQWCDASGQLQRQWKTNTDLIGHTRTLNDRNGALVNNRLKRVEGMLDTLNGPATRESRVYTARGNAYQQAQSGKVCNFQV
jgi:flagellar biosynthesis/type III secretory pathway chaperone